MFAFVHVNDDAPLDAPGRYLISNVRLSGARVIFVLAGPVRDVHHVWPSEDMEQRLKRFMSGRGAYPTRLLGHWIDAVPCGAGLRWDLVENPSPSVVYGDGKKSSYGPTVIDDRYPPAF